MEADLRRRVREAFAEGGPLASAIPGFEPRAGQRRLADAWAGALCRGETLVAEAATGIGKTLAYLVPCVLAGLRTLISTGTKTLQQQLLAQDIPRVRDALGIPFSCVVVKGRQNYLCRRRWERFAAEPLFEFSREASFFERMKRFAETTRTGDLSECPGIPEEFHAWSEVNARSETCDASACAETERCFLADVRRRAAAADLVVVNHHLFFAELSLRLRRGRGGTAASEGEVEVLPDVEALIFDEGQGLEEVASAFFGVTVSLSRALEIVREIRRAAASDEAGWGPVLPLAEEFRRRADLFFRAGGAGEGRFFLPAADPTTPFGAGYRDLALAGAELALSLSAAPAVREEGPDADATAELLRRRVDAFGEDLASLLMADSAEAFAWGERRGGTVVFHRTPVDVSQTLSGGLWNGRRPVLVTSATLSVSRDLSYFRRRVGLGSVDAAELIVDNEFDFGSRALCYVPRALPDPADEEFAEAAGREAVEVLRISGGGALVLCTSYRILGALAGRLREALPVTVLAQGDGPRHQLLAAFREDRDAVLIGTGTFWEGIDVPGESLRCVVIDKLPFAPPTDPVVTARIRALREQDRDPFREYQVPEAVLSLRQGVGRLLRHGGDFGVVVLLDRRILTRGYGGIFRENLPPMPWTRERAEVEQFFRRFGIGPEPAREGR